MSLLYITQQLTIYIGIFLLIIGVIGNGINILVFLKVRTYRQTPCTFYYLIGSMSNMFYILLNITVRILSVGFNIEVTNTSTVWCKIRQYFLVFPGILSMQCSCLAAIDQFLVTSKSIYLRSWSQIYRAHRILIIVTIFWCLHGIPILIFFEIIPSNKTCSNTNSIYVYYIIFYLLGIICGIPISVMILFGYLTYRNIHQTLCLAELQIDRQLIRMTYTHVILTTISLLPYGLFQTYSFLTKIIPKNTDRQLIENLFFTILVLSTYLYFVGSCYTFLVSSRRFRQRVRNIICSCRPQVQIHPH